MLLWLPARVGALRAPGSIFTLGIDGFRTAVFSAWLRMVLGARKALSWVAFQADGLKSQSSDFSPLFTDSPA